MITALNQLCSETEKKEFFDLGSNSLKTHNANVAERINREGRKGCASNRARERERASAIVGNGSDMKKKDSDKSEIIYWCKNY